MMLSFTRSRNISNAWHRPSHVGIRSNDALLCPTESPSWPNLSPPATNDGYPMNRMEVERGSTAFKMSNTEY
eukprot:11164157-Lingulodinium_polyedra.AAC.1